MQLTGVEVARGVASLAVCAGHLASVSGGTSWFHVISTYGYLGVQAFFVVSGFVIPYSLSGHAYVLRSYGRFVLKRIVRLEPPYLASVLFTVVAMQLVPRIPGVGGVPPAVDVGRLLSHVAYAWAPFGYDALSPVYWTLALEVQYYAMAGLLFPLWASHRAPGRLLSVVGLCTLAWVVPDPRLVFHWLPLFGLGVCGFQYRTGISSRAEAMVQLLLIAGLSAALHGLLATSVGLATLALICFAPTRVPGVLTWLGTISYSLYLVHVPIGSRIVSFGRRFGPELQPWFILAGLLSSLGAAWLFWWASERPARDWSTRIRYQTVRQASPSASPFVQ